MLTPPHSGCGQQAKWASAADLPPELFANIIWYLDMDFGDWPLPSRHLHDTGLVTGSLVCLYWAQQCRQMLYKGRAIQITSMKRAVRLRNLVVGAGSKSLTPIVKMIGKVDMWYNRLPEDGRSYPDIPGLQLSQFGRFDMQNVSDDMLQSRHHPQANEVIRQRIPSLPAGMRLGSPRWDVQKTLPYSLTSYRELALIDVCFGSLSDLRRFLRHFQRLEVLDLKRVRWTSADWHPRAPTRPRISSRPSDRPYKDTRLGIIGCTDNPLLWQLAFDCHTFFPLHAISFDDQQVMSQLVTRACTATAEITGSAVLWLGCTQRASGECISLIMSAR